MGIKPVAYRLEHSFWKHVHMSIDCTSAQSLKDASMFIQG